eukprot:CAMPEP_0168445900 /NCGR_PEP_ID=MMETSP0228-20121227/45801_1 /TAXON_ID=133427 /ORGANISM="Protoceratium reticulatum, Strain CCCM 535 (=CCMP 1889)" /LENGTH=49 /DNA_ID= /DNA_START= /DNA_END= /DNA_ORIENTATION=
MMPRAIAFCGQKSALAMGAPARLTTWDALSPMLALAASPAASAPLSTAA